MAVDGRGERHERPLTAGVAWRMAPWVVSAALHGGVLIALSLLVMMIAAPPSEVIVIPDARLSDQPGGALSTGPADADLQGRTPTEPELDVPEAADSHPVATERDVSEILGLEGGSSASLAEFAAAPAAKAPRSRFFGAGGNAHHIVYLVDRSGSMLDTLDLVKMEIARSIGGLQRIQDFHVIFFATGEPVEKPPPHLVPATDRFRQSAARFLKGIRAEGRTDPIPALERAFEVLRRASGRRPGKLIYLLTDGEFPDNQQVLKRLKTLNADRKVHINTILYSIDLPYDMDRPKGEAVLKQIARENGGTYVFVDENDSDPPGG